jgi:hypothetical protein
VTALTALAALQEEQRIQLTLEGRCPGGEVGAYFVRSSDGIPYVMKWSDDRLDLESYEDLVRFSSLCGETVTRCLSISDLWVSRTVSCSSRSG